MQTILIPTDFKLPAFDCIPQLCKQLKGQKLNIIFTHCFNLSDSISDLLMLSRRNREFEYISDEFYKHGEQIKRDYNEINAIKIDFFYGSSLAAFNAFIQTHEVTCILDPASCSYSKLNKRSLETISFVERTSIPVLKVLSDKLFVLQAVKRPTDTEILEEV